jgi:hypothetical protein
LQFINLCLGINYPIVLVVAGAEAKRMRRNERVRYFINNFPYSPFENPSIQSTSSTELKTAAFAVA